MLKPIRTKKEYKIAIDRLYSLMQKDIVVNSHEYNEMELLSIIIEDYEKKNFPIDLPDPVEAIKFRLDQLNLEHSALIKILGSKSRTSEILNKKRKLSLAMIRALHDKLNIPASSLISDYSQ